MNQKETFDLNKWAYALLQAEPFFAALSLKVNKIATSNVPTAGVRLNKDSQRFEMVYNPAFFDKLTKEQKLGVIKHEYYHLVLLHVTDRKPADESMFKTWNIAADLAINSFLVNELPAGCCMPGEGPFKDYPPKQAAEWYYTKLLNDPNFKPSEGEGQGQFDDHSQWGSSGEGGSPEDRQVQEVAAEKLKDDLRKAANQVAASQGWGTMTAEMRDKMLKLITVTLDWRKVLRYFVKTSQRVDKHSTVRRVNKRYPYVQPGKKVRRQAKIAIATDQSGSVSDPLLCTFFSYLNKLSEIADFVVIPFDHEICESKIYTWKRGAHHKAERVLCGGTCFNAPTRYVNDHPEFDGLIILTDMMADKPIRCRVQRLWMTDENGKQHAPFNTGNEQVVEVTVPRI
jgi:predicted metal-dependent peptidase